LRVYIHYLPLKGDSKWMSAIKNCWTSNCGESVERPQPVGVIIGFIMIFLVGLGIGDMLSKVRQANPVMASINLATPNASLNGEPQ
jgi:hypothetical protein